MIKEMYCGYQCEQNTASELKQETQKHIVSCTECQTHMNKQVRNAKAKPQNQAQNKTLTRCSKCNYEWQYKGKLYYAQCPRCRSLIRSPNTLNSRYYR